MCPSEEEIASIKWRNKVSNFFHGALDVGGFFFDGFDLVNAFIYAAEGNNTMAALSLVCMIPGFGTLFGIPAKIVARIGANVGEAFLKAGRQYFPEILEGGSKLFNRTRTQIDNARTWINQKINRLLGKSGSKSGTDAINLINGLPANQGYDSFRKLKNAIGSPGEGNHWHHIVEQSQIGKSGFSAQQIHNTSNIIAVDAATHAKITGYYNTTTYKFTGGLSVRDWLAGQSYEYQYEFGLNVLREYGVIE